jgi:hypothetical protein
MLERLETKPDSLKRVIIGDKLFYFGYDSETKRQSEEWQTPQFPRQKKESMSKLNIKIMVIIFFSILAGCLVNNLYHLVSQ